MKYQYIVHYYIMYNNLLFIYLNFNSTSYYQPTIKLDKINYIKLWLIFKIMYEKLFKFVLLKN